MDKTLLEECMEVLNTALLPHKESDKLSEQFNTLIPLSEWGKVDWQQINKKKTITYLDDIVPALETLLKKPIKKSVYLEWSEATLPVIKAHLDDVIRFFEYVHKVSFEVFIFNLEQGYIIEILPSGTITVGLIDKITGNDNRV